MAGLSRIIDVHSHPIFPFGQGAPVGAGHKQPDWSVESALAKRDERCVARNRMLPRGGSPPHSATATNERSNSNSNYGD